MAALTMLNKTQNKKRIKSVAAYLDQTLMHFILKIVATKSIFSLSLSLSTDLHKHVCDLMHKYLDLGVV